MKFLVLWDPDNPMTPVAAVVSALKNRAETVEATFDRVSHRGMPNGSFIITPILRETKPDVLLWIEGGPLPRDFAECEVRRACWLVNPHLEPSLSTIASVCDVRLTTVRTMTENEQFHWLPLSASDSPPSLNRGISFLGCDPTPPSHVRTLLMVSSIARNCSVPPYPIVVCQGQASQPHPGIMNRMAGGAVVIADSSSDLRDIAHSGYQVLTFRSHEDVSHAVEHVLRKPDEARAIAARAMDIVKHLHTPKARATQLLDAVWPRVRVLSGQNHSPSISVLTFCYKYLQRFRLYLNSLAKQDISDGSLEIVVVDPCSPDGLGDYLKEFAASNRHLRLVHMMIDECYHRNRGLCINRGFDASNGKVIVITDGDVIFPQYLVKHLATLLRSTPKSVIGVRRYFLNRQTTEEILSGRRDPVRDFKDLSTCSGDGESNAHEGVLGYCQVVSRDAFARARYPEVFDMTNQSDIVFLERLKDVVGVTPLCLTDCGVLHLWHPRPDWLGTKEFR